MLYFKKLIPKTVLFDTNLLDLLLADTNYEQSRVILSDGNNIFYVF